MATSKKDSSKGKITEKKPAKAKTPDDKKPKLAKAVKEVVKTPSKPKETSVKSSSKDKAASKPDKSKDKIAKAPVKTPSHGKTTEVAPREGKKIKSKNEKTSDIKHDEKVLAAVKTKVRHAGGKTGEGKAANPSAKTVKKTTVAVFTMENVREILQNRNDEAREEAEKIEAAARKAATNIVIPENTQNRVLGAATLADILGFGVPVQKQAASPTEQADKREIPAKFRKHYDMLISLRDKIQKKINHRSHSDKGNDVEATVAVPAQTEDDDTFDHDFALSLVANEQDALLEVNAAIDRIFDGSYGICEITGRPISNERLDAVPFARYSVEGQAQFEMQNRRRSQRTTAFLDSSDDASSFVGEEAADE
jgi:RNA polymerase-binding transcription factor DksA